MNESITPNPPDSSEKLVSQSEVMREQLRKEFVELLIASLTTIAELDVRDGHGKIIETGHSIIETILTMERQRKDIKEQIQIIGERKWLKLKQLWCRMREIETEDKLLSSRPK